ncbi:WYL domain-containing protein [Marinospirillum minutulum]|uniref:WYL domain-containing protein n=1 Tax=Marinospirillum minutulum TaxID=64974 RepID=UPI002480F999|nr:WYL domain-containing protein [Marinospirillum minutulum]
MNLKLQLAAHMSSLLSETPLSANQKLVQDDKNEDNYILEAEVLDGMQLRRWLLSQGKGLVVLAPETLRDWMKETLSQQLGQYT